MQDRLEVPVMLGEAAGEEEVKDSLGDLGVPALQSSLTRRSRG